MGNATDFACLTVGVTTTGPVDLERYVVECAAEVVEYLSGQERKVLARLMVNHDAPDVAGMHRIAFTDDLYSVVLRPLVESLRVRCAVSFSLMKSEVKVFPVPHAMMSCPRSAFLNPLTTSLIASRW